MSNPFSRALRAVSVALLVGLLISSAASGSLAKKPPAPQPKKGPAFINIGGFYTLSGTVLAPQALWGSQLGVDAVNLKGINGSKLNLVVKDHQCAADNMRDAFLSAVQSHIVAGVTSCSGPSKASAPLAAQYKVLNFNIGGSDPSIGGLSPYLFSSLVLGNVTVKVALDQVKNSLKKTRLAVIYANDPVGNALNGQLAKDAPKYGVNIVSTASYETGQQDFSAVLAKISSSNPEVIYLATLGTEAALIIKQVRQQGINAQLISYVGAYGNIPSVAGNALEGLLWTSPYLDLTSAAYKAYQTRYSAAHSGQAPGYVDVTAYDTIKIIGQALLASAKTGQWKWWTGERLRAQILKIKTFSGLAGGSYAFQPDGTVQRPVQVYRWSGGAPTLVADYSLKKIAGLR